MSSNTGLKDRIGALHRQFGIPDDYAASRSLAPCEECGELVSIGEDMFGREQRMIPAAAQAWLKMKISAARNGIELQVVSAFRSIDYQAGIIQKKLDNGQPIDQILQVSAAPGYSEHHTGRALDISTPGCDPLEVRFEQTAAFAWLLASAADFGFRLSFPKRQPPRAGLRALALVLEPRS